MADEATAVQKRDLALSHAGYQPSVVKEGEYVAWVVNKAGRQAFVSSEFAVGQKPYRVPLETIFLPNDDAHSLTLHIVYSRYFWGRKPVRVIFRAKFRVRLVTSGALIFSPSFTLDLPKFVRLARLSVFERVLRPKGSSFNRSSNVRPSPEVKTSSVYSVRWREGLGFDSESNIPYDTYRRTWSGSRTPGFRTLKKRALPVNPHHVLLVTQNRSSMYAEKSIPTLPGNRSWTLGDFCDWASLHLPRTVSHDDNCTNLAVKRVIQRTESGIEGNIAQDVVQLGQTVRVITDAAERITTAVHATRKGNIPVAVDVLWHGRSPKFKKGKEPDHGATAANNWLALQYGWKPLLQDIQGSMEALARLNLADSSVREVTASAKMRTHLKEDITDDLYHTTTIGHLSIVQESRCKIGLKYRVENHLRAFLAQTGFTNPINLAWEVLPYSFVVDWFLPIGPYLESLTAFDGLEFWEGYQTNFTRQNIFGVADFTGTLAPYAVVYKGEYSSETVKLDREKLFTFPRLSYPKLKNPFSVDHSLNAIALMRSAFK